MSFISAYRKVMAEAVIAGFRATFFPAFWIIGLEAHAVEDPLFRLYDVPRP